MRRTILILAVLISLLLISGCAQGLIYTHTVEPFTLNMHNTPVVSGKEKGDTKQLTIYYLRFKWDDNSIGSIAKERGFTELYYADHEILSILGIWRQDFVNLYGK